MARMTQTEAWTIQRLMDWTRQFFQRKNVPEPRLATELLLAHALSVRKIDLYTRFEQVVPDGPLAVFRDLVRRAAEGEPIAYLIGYREFFSLSIKVTPDVLIPRPETETLVSELIHVARQSGKDPATLRILDLATGSGCIAIALATHLPGATVIATDVSPAALAVAAENAATHKVTIDFRAGPLYEPVADGPPFDFICSNPPYISAGELPTLPHDVRDFEPAVALVAGPSGLEVIEPLIAGAPARLIPGGMVFIEIGYTQADKVVPLAAGTTGLADVRTVKDSLGHQRVVVAKRTE